MSYEARDDIHRRGAIQPEFYKFVGWYTLRSLHNGGGSNLLKSSIESWEGSEEAQDFKAMQYGTWGQCGVCGAHFVCGEVWQHDDRKDMLHVGWECALKYRLVSNTDWTAIQAERERAMKAARTQQRNATARAKLLSEHPELADALEVDHHISRDLKWKLGKYGSLSLPQVALALRVRDQVRAAAVKRAKIEAERAAEIKVPAPTGRVTVRGVVVSLKDQETAYGVTLRMTVKVTTSAGVWLTWGTVPSCIAYNDKGERLVRVGDEIEFSATLKPGRDPFFALLSRPTKASIVTSSSVVPAVAPAQATVFVNPVKSVVQLAEAS